MMICPMNKLGHVIIFPKLNALMRKKNDERSKFVPLRMMLCHMNKLDHVMQFIQVYASWCKVSVPGYIFISVEEALSNLVIYTI